MSILYLAIILLPVNNILAAFSPAVDPEPGNVGMVSAVKLSGWDTEEDVQLKLINGNFSKLYTDTVNNSKMDLYRFNYSVQANQTSALRISTSITGNASQYPVMFVIRQEKGVISWQIPLVLEYNFPHYAVERTLCPVEILEHEDRQLYVEVSTMYKTDVSYTLEVHRQENFTILTGQDRTVKSSPSKPVYYMYTFPEGVSKVLVRATSEDSLCMVLSVQTTNCPVFDLDRNVDYDGNYQTMTKQGAIAVEETFGKSFFIVVVVKPNDDDCHLMESISREKTVTLHIQETIPSSQYYKATLAAAGLYLAFYLVALFIGIFYHSCKKNWGMITLTQEEEEETNVKQPLVQRAERSNYGATPISQEIAEVTNYPSSSANQTEEDDYSVDSLDSGEYDMLRDADKDKYIVRTKTALFVKDLSLKSEKRQSKNYKLYTKNLLIIAIFYGLPVLQLVLTYQQVLNDTGNQDICYYNFDCANPFMKVTSFNNIYSNIGYVLLGILFLILVARRDFLHKKAVQKSKGKDRLYGIPQHYGLFYAMGFALVMEGFMSACYHVCPTVSNFQFDTSFMYIMACLCILKIYQNRHPDISAKAHTSYLVMAFVIIVAVVGVVYGTNAFWIIFALIYIFCSLMLSIHLYYLGQWQLDRYICKRLWLLIRTDWCRCSRPLYMNRLILLLLGNAVNWAIVIYGVVTGFADFASFLLIIFIGNLLLYSTFYIVMKWFSKEKIPVLTYMLIVLSIVCWGVSLKFFTAHLTTWELTPALSREGNKPCIVLEFYDAHDVWHFLSAISLFFSFLVLLTLDDEIILTRRDQIPVF